MLAGQVTMVDDGAALEDETDELAFELELEPDVELELTLAVELALAAELWLVLIVELALALAWAIDVELEELVEVTRRAPHTPFLTALPTEPFR